MVIAGKYNIVCQQGSSFDKTFTYSIGGSLVNLTGYSASMQIRRSFDSSPVLSLTSGSGITLGGALGTILVEIDYATTTTLESGQYLYDLEITSPANKRDRILTGSFTVTREVTRA